MRRSFKNAEPMWVVGFVVLVIFASMLLGGCNTVAGLGRDITGAANGIASYIADDYDQQVERAWKE